MPLPPYIVGLTGASASGKTHIIRRVTEALTDEWLTVMSLDNYYLPVSVFHTNPESLPNWDHPTAIHFEQCLQDLDTLRSGKSISFKEYTFNNPNLIPKLLTLQPAPIILLEGLLLYANPVLKKKFDLKIFVEADEHIIFSRRLIRDMNERGYPLQEIIQQYEQTVVPMYRQFVLPHRADCELIIQNNGSGLDKAIELLTDHLQAQAQKRSMTNG
jgi:uridine kinase